MAKDKAFLKKDISKEQILAWFKDKQKRQKSRTFVYSNFVLTALLVLLQIILFFVLVLKFQPYIEYYFGSSILLSFFFMIYLSNTEGKNEFKITWMLPLIIFPLFGILAYILYHTNAGGTKLKKRVLKGKEKTSQFFLPLNHTAPDILKIKDKDICHYMINTAGLYPYTNNELTFIKNGESFFPKLINELKKAKKFIFLEFFIIVPDESFEQILDVLEERANNGVEVRLLYDGIGSIMASSQYYLDYLKSRKIEARIFSKVIPLFSTKQNNRDHRKIIVIDDKVAFTGGLNLSNEYFNYGKNRFSYWKDNGVFIKGSAVRAFTTLFFQNWYLEDKKEEDYLKYYSKEYKFYESQGFVIPYADDAFNQEDIAEDLYNYLIVKSTKYVYITSPYLIIDNQLYSQIILTKKLGVEVVLILPSVPDHFITFCIGRTYIKKMIENGIKIYLYNKGFIHSKTVISDGKMASIGSVNLDYRSFYHHFECGILISDNPIIKTIEQDFLETLQNSTLITKDTYKKIPKRHLVLGYLFRIFGPLM